MIIDTWGREVKTGDYLFHPHLEKDGRICRTGPVTIWNGRIHVIITRFDNSCNHDSCGPYKFGDLNTGEWVVAPKDCNGNPIYPGDTLWFDRGKGPYTSPGAKVLEISKDKITVCTIRENRTIILNYEAIRMSS
jgi:hypothetical protein